MSESADIIAPDFTLALQAATYLHRSSLVNYLFWMLLKKFHFLRIDKVNLNVFEQLPE